MKKNDSGDFCVLYAEVGDDKNAVLQMIAGQKKPVVIMLSEQERVFQRPDDFTTLKHLKRQLDLPVLFVIPGGGQSAHQAARNGFPVYLSMDALADALSVGNLVRQRSTSRATVPLRSGELRSGEHLASPKKTIPLSMEPKKTVPLTMKDEIARQKTMPLPTVSSPSLIAPPPPASKLKRARKPQRRFPVLLVLLTFALVIAGLGSFLVLAHTLPTVSSTGTPLVTPLPAPMIVGQITFTSSEQLSETSSQGIEDRVAIDLHNMTNPVSQKSYYAWLLSDKKQSDPKSMFLGKLQVNKGSAHLFYAGDALHSNLLQVFSRFLVTQEDAGVTPIAPTPDMSMWRFYGEFSSALLPGVENAQKYSYLDHLRHLLAADPTLDELELPGGLNNWLYQNTSKILEWLSSTREQWEEVKDVGLVKRQTIRTLEYLDGTSFVYQDLPATTPLLVNERLARIGLLEVNGQAQDPPSYVDHIVRHLNGLLQAGGNTSVLRKDEADLIAALNNVNSWLTQVRHDAQQVLKMSDQQLQQPGTLMLLNDMIANANNAYVGELDPNTNQMRQGVVWIHTHMQELATLQIQTLNAGSSHLQMIPNSTRAVAFTPYRVQK